jgi:hypothetical protein
MMDKRFLASLTLREFRANCVAVGTSFGWQRDNRRVRSRNFLTHCKLDWPWNDSEPTAQSNPLARLEKPEFCLKDNSRHDTLQLRGSEKNREEQRDEHQALEGPFGQWLLNLSGWVIAGVPPFRQLNS